MVCTTESLVYTTAEPFLVAETMPNSKTGKPKITPPMISNAEESPLFIMMFAKR